MEWGISYNNNMTAQDYWSNQKYTVDKAIEHGNNYLNSFEDLGERIAETATNVNDTVSLFIAENLMYEPTGFGGGGASGYDASQMFTATDGVF